MKQLLSIILFFGFVGCGGRPSASIPSRIVFIGDSITECFTESVSGSCTADPGLPLYPGMIGLNHGVSGQTTADILARFQHDALDPQFWPDGVTASADAVVIEENTNDYSQAGRQLTLQQTEDNIRTMVSMALASNTRVVVQTMLPTAVGSFQFADPPNDSMSYNGLYDADYNFRFLHSQPVMIADTYSAIVDRESCQSSPPFNCFAKAGMLVDGIHPSQEGFAAMFPVLQSAIRAALSH